MKQCLSVCLSHQVTVEYVLVCLSVQGFFCVCMGVCVCVSGVRKFMCFINMRAQVCLSVYEGISQNECGCVPEYSLCLV